MHWSSCTKPLNYKVIYVWHFNEIMIMPYFLHIYIHHCVNGRIHSAEIEKNAPHIIIWYFAAILIGSREQWPKLQTCKFTSNMLNKSISLFEQNAEAENINLVQVIHHKFVIDLKYKTAGKKSACFRSCLIKWDFLWDKKMA